MKTCPFCRAENDVGYRFCRQCGQPLDSLVLSTGEPVPAGSSTVMVTTTGARTQMRRTVPLATLFAQRRELVIGRAPDCDVCLQHPSVSRYHALLVRVEQGVQVSDLSSVNGVQVNGQRITTPVLVRDKETVGIGPFLFTLLGDTMQSLDSSRALRLEARALEKQVIGFDGQPKKLLDNINLVLQPGEFVSLLGPSGSGKSTLMDCLNGRRRATGGQVLANGEDFYRHFDSFRQLLGYVPQKDIVHGGLTVFPLYYTARLRLPTDTDPTELNARVEEVLKEMELLPHRNTLVADLSGGQIKRVSLGAELLARPCLLYIDEATSGLDAGTEARMMRLFRRLADEGRSLICITHNIDNVDQCHLALVLARGKLLYYGPPGEAPGYFGVHRMSEVYDRIQARQPDEWERQFRELKFHADYVAYRLAASTAGSEPPRLEVPTTANLIESSEPPTPSKKPLLARKLHDMYALAGRVGELIKPVSEHWHQLRVLTRRYAHLIWNDPRSLRLLFLQSPIIALFLLIGFMNKPYEAEVPATRRLTDVEQFALRTGRDALAAGIPFDRLTREQQRILRDVEALVRVNGLDVNRLDVNRAVDYLLKNEEPVIPSHLIVNPAYTYMLLSITCIAVLWFGCNNAAKEIVKEEAIYNRERAVNLKILPYLGSKFLMLSLISAVQTFLYMLVMYGVLEAMHLLAGQQMPPARYVLNYPAQYGVLLLLAMSGVALGLLLSACVSSADRANALLPYVLIPQMILGGGVIVVREGVIYWLAVTLSPVYWAFRGIRLGECELPPDFYYAMSYDDRLWLPCTALLIQTAVLLLVTAWFLKRKDAQ